MYNGYYYGFDMTYLVLVVPALLKIGRAHV